MSDLEELAKKMQEKNPANAIEKPAAERRRIPMTSTQRKLEMPEIPGYHCQWIFDGVPGRVQQALNGGFEFVHPDEVSGNAVALGSEPLDGASTDLGTRVSVGEGGGRLYYMKQKLEYYHEDQSLREKRNDEVRDALVAGQFGDTAENAADRATRFVDPVRSNGIPELFKRKPSKGAT
jgi:hypothetical protein